jgi:hypothetical protein
MHEEHKAIFFKKTFLNLRKKKNQKFLVSACIYFLDITELRIMNVKPDNLSADTWQNDHFVPQKLDTIVSIISLGGAPGD